MEGLLLTSDWGGVVEGVRGVVCLIKEMVDLENPPLWSITSSDKGIISFASVGGFQLRKPFDWSTALEGPETRKKTQVSPSFGSVASNWYSNISPTVNSKSIALVMTGGSLSS